MENVSIRSYRNPPRYNAMLVVIGSLALYFSYQTVVGFSEAGHLSRVSENCWGPTTGAHLNLLESDKKARLPRAEFEKELSKVLKKHGLAVS